MTPYSIPLPDIARFSFDGQVWRSFGRLIAVRPGALLLVPVALGSGSLEAVRDGSPVRWQEVWAVIDTPRPEEPEQLSPGDLLQCAPLVAALFPPYGWVQDRVSCWPFERSVYRVTSPDGVMFSWIPGFSS